jgi:hypothetical protein
LRLVAIVLGGIGLVIGAIYVAIVVAFPPARLAVLLADQVKAATGREFRINGGLSIRVLPTIAIQVNDVVLGNAAWGSRADMVTVRRAAIEVSPGALLEGELRILRIDVEGVDALLESDGAARYNWQFTPATSPARDTKPPPADARAPRFELNRLVASDVLVAYRDSSKSPPQTLAIESLDMRSNDRGNEIALALAVGKQRWKVEGQVGRGAILLEGKEDWPFDLRLASDGATGAAKGAMGTGERAGTVAADVSAEVTTAAVLAPLGSDAAMVPLPLALRARVRARGPSCVPIRCKCRLAGQTIEGRMTVNTAQPRPKSRRGADIEIDRLDEARASRVVEQARRARAGGPEGARAAVRRRPAAVRRGSRCRPQRRAQDGEPETSRDAVAVRRARSGSRRLLVGSCSTTSSSGSLADGSAAGRTSCSPRARQPRVDVFFDAKSLSVEALDVAMAGGGHFQGAGPISCEPGHGRRNAEAACRVCER